MNAEYWDCLLTLAEHELEASRLVHEAEAHGLHVEQQPGVRAVGAPLPHVQGSAGVHKAVQQQVELLLSGKGRLLGPSGGVCGLLDDLGLTAGKFAACCMPGLGMYAEVGNLSGSVFRSA